MENKKMSLMERRKQKLQGLQGTISKLSVVENQLKVPTMSTNGIHTHSMNQFDYDSNGKPLRSPNALTQKKSGGSMVSSEDEDMKGHSIHKFDEIYEIL